MLRAGHCRMKSCLSPVQNLQGCLELLDRAGVKIAGKRAVVVGRSNIVGMPVAALLTNRDATVTVLHSKTQNAAEICSSADIVIAAVGSPEVVKADWIKPGAAVIDVGTNAVDVSHSFVLYLSYHKYCKHGQSTQLQGWCHCGGHRQLWIFVCHTLLCRTCDFGLFLLSAGVVRMLLNSAS